MIKFQPSFKNVGSKAGYEELVRSEVEVLQRVGFFRKKTFFKFSTLI